MLVLVVLRAVESPCAGLFFGRTRSWQTRRRARRLTRKLDPQLVSAGRCEEMEFLKDLGACDNDTIECWIKATGKAPPPSLPPPPPPCQSVTWVDVDLRRHEPGSVICLREQHRRSYPKEVRGRRERKRERELKGPLERTLLFFARGRRGEGREGRRSPFYQNTTGTLRSRFRKKETRSLPTCCAETRHSKSLNLKDIAEIPVLGLGVHGPDGTKRPYLVLLRHVVRIRTAR